eukprot:2425155-Pyramimonas_sp.AAC.1
MDEGVTWKSSRGPIQRMQMSLNRIGWRSVSALTWLDDTEGVVHLGYNPPALIGQLLQLGTQRHHERVLARLLPPFNGTRVCTEPLARLLCPESKKLAPRERYIVTT